MSGTAWVEGGEQLIGWMESMGLRATRTAFLPVMAESFKPVVAAERASSAFEDVSGALRGSLRERSGPGDRPGVISVYSAPTARGKRDLKGLVQRWSVSPRGQHRMLAARLKSEKFKSFRVFYGDFVEAGHRLVRGEKVIGFVPAHAFATPAIEAVGSAAADVAAEKMMDIVLGG